MFYFYLQDIASHKYLAIGMSGNSEDVLDLVDGTKWATAWTHRKDAQTHCDKLNNDFSHSLAGTTFVVDAKHYTAE